MSYRNCRSPQRWKTAAELAIEEDNRRRWEKRKAAEPMSLEMLMKDAWAKLAKRERGE